jgi:hypothetical protein
MPSSAPIGPAESARSYLDIDALVGAGTTLLELDDVDTAAV